MKNLTLFVLLLFGQQVFSQIPSGYYTNANGLNGTPLKTALYDIIKEHKEFPYSSSNTDVWDILKETDKDTNNPNNIILLYTGWSVDAAQEYNSGNGWNREHVWSKSHGSFGTSMGAGTDVHHLRPSDISVNSAKNSRWFDNCSTPYLDNGNYTGCFTSSTNWVWQPRDEVKGDVARMIFYMATRYEGDSNEPDLEIVDYLPTDNYTSDPVYSKLSTLLQWHMEDAVDDWERNRNDIIYYDFQNNRNPFIDHPEYANLIWDLTTATPQNEDAHQLKIYPNPIKNYFTIDTEEEVQRVEITDITGRVVKNVSALTEVKTVDCKDFKNGLYIVKVYTEKEVILSKIIKE